MITLLRVLNLFAGSATGVFLVRGPADTAQWLAIITLTISLALVEEDSKRRK